MLIRNPVTCPNRPHAEFDPYCEECDKPIYQRPKERTVKTRIPTPAEVRDRLAENMEPLMEAAREVVFNALLRRTAPQVTIASKLIDRRVLPAIVDEIRAAGWYCAEIDDQRDGSYLAISEKP
jgi:hypothetical protein